MPMIYVTVAGETFGIKTAKQEAMLHRMEKNYGPFMTADTVPAEKVLFIADIDRTVTVPAGEPLKTFDYALTEDAARLRIYPDRCLLSITHKASSKTFSIACPLRSDSPDDTPAYPADLTMQGIAPPGHILDHLLIFALSVAAVGKGILLIHASTIRYRGKAVMYPPTARRLTVLRGAVKPRVTVPNTTPWRPWSASGGPPTIKSPV